MHRIVRNFPSSLRVTCYELTRSASGSLERGRTIANFYDGSVRAPTLNGSEPEVPTLETISQGALRTALRIGGCGRGYSMITERIRTGRPYSSMAAVRDRLSEFYDDDRVDEIIGYLAAAAAANLIRLQFS